jgi:hypothetical protein
MSRVKSGDPISNSASILFIVGAMKNMSRDQQKRYTNEKLIQYNLDDSG